MAYICVILGMSFIGGAFGVAEPGPYIPPLYQDDPELYVEWTTPKNMDFWWRYTPGSVYTGLLYAGKTEFPYIVDIRGEDLDQEGWSTGNLITWSHVMTNCRGIMKFETPEHVWLTFDYDIGGSFDYSINHGIVVVNYCGSYLWEDYLFASALHNFRAEPNKFDTDVPDSGSRTVNRIWMHPECYDIKNSISIDIGIMQLTQPIKPLPPLVDVAAIWFSPDSQTITDVDLSNMVKQRRICYIASFGRNWRNHFDSYVRDYKVKYRVYYENIDACKKELDSYERVAERLTNKYTSPKDDTNLMCFKTRARTGAVCDHDRGAPLVCDDRIYGFTSRAANFSKCNNLLSLPFLVQKASVLNNFYANVVRHIFVHKYQPEKKKKKSASGRNDFNTLLIVSSVYAALSCGRFPLPTKNFLSTVHS